MFRQIFYEQVALSAYRRLVLESISIDGVSDWLAMALFSIKGY